MLTFDGVIGDTRKARTPAYVAGTERAWSGPLPVLPPCVLCGLYCGRTHGPMPLAQLIGLLNTRERIALHGGAR